MDIQSPETDYSTNQLQCDRIAQIPEILLTILEPLTGSDLVAPMTVNKLWSEVALDLLWKEIDVLVPLFKILAPMIKENSSSLWFFERGLSEARWDRFARYSHRVRSLVYWGERDPDEEAEPRIAHSALLQFLMCRPPEMREIFPRLVKLEWAAYDPGTGTAAEVIAFLSSGVQDLHLVIYDPLDGFLDTLYSVASVSHCQLRRFTISTLVGIMTNSIRAGGFSQALLALFRRHPNISDLLVPAVRWRDGVFLAICTLGQLQRVNITLRISMVEEVRGMVGDLVASCQGLRDIVCRFGSDRDPTVDVSFEDVSDLLRLNLLSRLRLESMGSFKFSVADVEAMGTAWPEMEDLEFQNWSKLRVFRPPLSILTIFANSFSQTLRSLALPLSLDGPMPVLEASEIGFARLRFLRFAFGDTMRIIEESERAAIVEYLGYLTPEGVEIQVSPFYTRGGVYEREMPDKLEISLQCLVDMTHRILRRGIHQRMD